MIKEGDCVRRIYDDSNNPETKNIGDVGIVEGIGFFLTLVNDTTGYMPSDFEKVDVT